MEKKTAWWRVACTRHTHRRPLAVALPSNYCETVADIIIIFISDFFRSVVVVAIAQPAPAFVASPSRDNANFGRFLVIVIVTAGI